MGEPITWKVKGSDRIHSIPDRAVVTVQGKNGEIKVWVNVLGEVLLSDERKDSSGESESLS